jgi:hypothetical protein
VVVVGCLCAYIGRQVVGIGRNGFCMAPTTLPTDGSMVQMTRLQHEADVLRPLARAAPTSSSK